MDDLTVTQLIDQLRVLPQDQIVRVWLPGSYISLRMAFEQGEQILIEGSIVPGSAIEEILG